MPPKAEDGVSEAYAKGLDRGLRGLLSVRALIWRTQAGREESAQLGVFNEELKHFLSAADEFLAPDDTEMASARARYAAIARHRLLRPQILALRGMKEGPVAPKELAPVVLAVLAAFAALFVWAKNKDSAAARPLQYYEAWLAAEPASLVAVTESSIRAYVSVLDFVEAKHMVASHQLTDGGAGVATQNTQLQKRGREVCYVCQEYGHYAKACPKRVPRRL
jgi:hypothetical protein